MTANNDHIPTDAIIIGDDGLPIAHINFDQLHTDATLLMYELAATAGNDQATDEVATRWATKLEPDYMGYVAAGCGSPEIVEGSLCRFRRDVGFPDLVVDRR